MSANKDIKDIRSLCYIIVHKKSPKISLFIENEYTDGSFNFWYYIEENISKSFHETNRDIKNV